MSVGMLGQHLSGKKKPQNFCIKVNWLSVVKIPKEHPTTAACGIILKWKLGKESILAKNKQTKKKKAQREGNIEKYSFPLFSKWFSLLVF